MQKRNPSWLFWEAKSASLRIPLLKIPKGRANNDSANWPSGSARSRDETAKQLDQSSVNKTTAGQKSESRPCPVRRKRAGPPSWVSKKAAPSGERIISAWSRAWSYHPWSREFPNAWQPVGAAGLQCQSFWRRWDLSCRGGHPMRPC